MRGRPLTRLAALRRPSASPSPTARAVSATSDPATPTTTTRTLRFRSPSPPASPRLPRGGGLPSLEDLRPAGEASIVSAVALILGSTIGAGILALPAVGAPAGFGPSAAVLGAVCAALTAEALLIAEVNLAVLADRRARGGGGGDGLQGASSSSASEEDIVTLRDMAAATLGPRGGAFVSTAYLSLSYALLVAYIAKAGELVAAGAGMMGGGGDGGASALLLTPGAGAVTFVAATGAVLYAGTGAVDNVNRAMTAGLLALYAGIVAAGAAGADWGVLSQADWSAAPASVPVVLLALVYHDLVPVVVAQLRGDAGAVRTSLLIGSAAPLAMFCLWDAVALALAGGGGGGGGGAGAAAGADPLDLVMATGGPAMQAAVAGFSVLAIATSCLGTSLGLSQTVIAELRGAAREWLAGSERKAEEAAADDAAATAAADLDPLTRLVTALGAARLDGEEEEECVGATPAALPPTATPLITGDLPGLRALAFALVLGPPTAAALANPGSFFAVLNAVGGYGMTALYGVLPPLMAWKLRRGRSSGDGGGRAGVAPPSTPPLLPGGTPVLASLCAGAVAIEVGRLADDLGGALAGAGGDGAAVTAAVAAPLADLAAADGLLGALARAVGLG